MFARFFIESGTLGKSFILLLSLALALCLRLRVFVVWSLPLLLFLFPPHLTPPPPPFLLIFATKASINSVHYYTDVFCWFQSQLNESLNKCSLASWGPALSWFIALTLERRFNSVISGSDLLALGLLLKVNLCLYCREQGVKGLYKGLEAKLLQTVSTAALMFVTYEKIAAFIFRLLRRTQRW